MVPILAPKMMPIPASNEINPALRKEIVITDTSELDCMIVVVTIPNSRDRGTDPVAFSSTLSRNPPLNSLNPSSSISMPNRKMATPAAIS